jgi:toxin-antitoxin system PIN domain toxin
MIALLDVNVLIPLFDSSHLHHDAAHRWFASNRRHGWATCALTENAFVRIVSNRAYKGRLTTVADATQLLRELCSLGGHVFWADAISIREQNRFHWNHVQGHGQVADAYLLALAVSHEGRLATFDAAISLRAVSGATAQNLEIIAA